MRSSIRVPVLLGLAGIMFFSAGGSVSNTTILADTQHSIITDKQEVLKAPVLKSVSVESDGGYALKLEAPVMENSGVTGEYINIRWNASEACDGYFIERKSGDGAYKRIAVRNALEECAYSDRNVSAGETYRYRIRCFRRVDGVMYLGPITETNAYTVSLDVPVITNLQYNSEKTRLQVQWKKISGADWYEILQKDSGGWKRIAVSEDNNYELETDTGRKYTLGIRAVMNQNGKKMYSRTEENGVTAPDGTFEHLKILFEGDSIALGKGKYSRSVCPPSQRVQLLLGCQVSNLAVTCSAVGPNTASGLPNLYERLINGEVSYQGYDVICIGIGSNDYTFSAPLGTADDTADDGTFCGYMNDFLDGVRRQNPSAVIVLETPSYRLRVGKSYEKGVSQKENRVGSSAADYEKAMIDAAKRHTNTRVYVQRTAGVITSDNADTLLYDGLHPNDEGYARMGDDLCSFLKSNVLS